MPRGGGRVPEQHPAHAHTMRGGQGGWDPHPRGPRRPRREAGGHGEGHGRHQRRHDRGAEELGCHGQVLRPLRPLLQQGLLQQGGRGRVEGRRRRLQSGVQPTTARHGPQLHGPADRIHRQDHERRPRDRDGREHGAGGGHGGQHAKHGAGYRQLAAEPGGAAQQDHAQGGSQREERGRGRGEGARTHEGLNPVAHRPSPIARRPPPPRQRPRPQPPGLVPAPRPTSATPLLQEFASAPQQAKACLRSSSFTSLPSPRTHVARRPQDQKIAIT